MLPCVALWAAPDPGQGGRTPWQTCAERQAAVLQTVTHQLHSLHRNRCFLTSMQLAYLRSIRLSVNPKQHCAIPTPFILFDVHNPRFALQGASVLEVARRTRYATKLRSALACCGVSPTLARKPGLWKRLRWRWPPSHSTVTIVWPGPSSLAAWRPHSRCQANTSQDACADITRDACEHTRCPRHPLPDYETVEAARHELNFSVNIASSPANG